MGGDYEDYEERLEELGCIILSSYEWPTFIYDTAIDCAEGTRCQLGSRCGTKGTLTISMSTFWKLHGDFLVKDTPRSPGDTLGSTVGVVVFI